jgi:hypothetical protein
MTLRIIASVLAVLAVGGAMLAWRRAPAVTLALATGLASAVVAYAISRADGPRGVPAVVTEWFSLGLAAGGLVGLAVTRRRTPGTWPMRRAAADVLIVTPFAFDLLGGWITGVVGLIALDLVAIAVLLWFAPGSRHRAADAAAVSS